MNKSSLLTQLAMAGIAAGLVSITPALALEEMKPDSSKSAAADTAKPAKKIKKAKKAKKVAAADSTVKADSAKVAPTIADTAKGNMGGGHMKHDSTMKKHMQDSSMRGKSGMTKDKHSCKGKNSCKGMGGCAMTQKDLEAAAKKMGVAMDKAGQPHGCKGMNECKGLGGCGMM